MEKALPGKFETSAPVTIRYVSVAGILILALTLLSLTLTVNISGVVNDYAAVTAIHTWSVEVSDASAFSEGDKILLIQMKGAIISEEDNATYGDIQSFGNAGNYEFHTIDAISGTTISFHEIICSDFTVEDLVQIVRVPVYDDVTVSGVLYAAQWNGTTGGILALEATGTLTLNANIDVRDAGFNGGDRNGSAHTGGLTYICAFNSGQGGIKGEGITEILQDACRGKLANGGGGGNDHNGGGGGGANYGSGGVGGHGWKSNTAGNLSDLDKGGRGGEGLSELYELGIPKLFLGGGGGGGHQNNGAALAASNGAGIVIIIAPVLNIASPVTIMANAMDATDVYVNDGAGGGGAGGAVLFDVETFISPGNLDIDVSGGDGASVITRDQHGPGGGGAGGYVNANHPLSEDIDINLEGGAAGLFISTTNPSNPLSNTSHGAAKGEDGSLVENLVLQTCSFPPILDLDKNESGYDFSTSMVIHAGSVSIADSSKDQISDDDNLNMFLAVIVLENALDGEDEGLLLPGSLPAGLSANISADNYTITITGEGTIRDYEKAISMVRYFNNSASPDMSQRQVSVFVNDGGAESNTAFTYITLTDVLLEIKWTFFTVSQQAGDFLLEWQLSSPVNNPCFEVLRSIDGVIFEKLTDISYAKYLPERKSWLVRDNTLSESDIHMVYYQVSCHSDNGFYISSPIVGLTYQANRSMKIEGFQDRENSQLIVQYSAGKSEKYSLSVTDLRGNTMWYNQYFGQTLSGKIYLNIATWTPGIYFVGIESEGTRKTQKIMIR
ncbi:MAG: T9SS type A sorting domain-containing protein [Bacteroidia bacterium]